MKCTLVCNILMDDNHLTRRNLFSHCQAFIDVSLGRRMRTKNILVEKWRFHRTVRTQRVS